VFVKYTTWSTGIQLKSKHKIILYASQGSKEIVGEGTIEKVEFLTSGEVLKKYGNKVILNKDELEKYMMREPNRMSKKMLVIVFSKVREYTPHIKYKKPITMAGQYLTRDEYSEFFQN
jgi:hypothetical protein